MKSIAIALVLVGLLVADAMVVTKYGYNHDHAGFYGFLFLIFGIVFIIALIGEKTT